MGMIGSVLGSALVGFGMSAMGGKPSFSYGTDVHSGMAGARPEVPELPSSAEVNPKDSNAQQNALMEQEREKERQIAALKREQSKQVFTSGLGAGGMAETSKKSLLGG